MELAEGNENSYDSLRLDRMGIEPLSEDFTGRWLWNVVVKKIIKKTTIKKTTKGIAKGIAKGITKGEGRAIKDALMDQSCIAGLGNIYVNEALWRARVHPFRRVGMLSRVECGRIVRSVKRVLSDAIAMGGSSLRDYRGGMGGWVIFSCGCVFMVAVERVAKDGVVGEGLCGRCEAGGRVIFVSACGRIFTDAKQTRACARGGAGELFL